MHAPMSAITTNIRTLIVCAGGLQGPPKDKAASLEKMNIAGRQETTRRRSSGILKIIIFDTAMTDQWNMNIRAKKFIRLLNVISTPSIYRATALGITGVVMQGNSSPRASEIRG